jgi:hypothetical protein
MQGYLRGNYGDLGTSDAKDQKDEEEEAKHVVELVLPDAADDEEKLNENGAKGQDTCGALRELCINHEV